MSLIATDYVSLNLLTSAKYSIQRITDQTLKGKICTNCHDNLSNHLEDGQCLFGTCHFSFLYCYFCYNLLDAKTVIYEIETKTDVYHACTCLVNSILKLEHKAYVNKTVPVDDVILDELILRKQTNT